MSTARVRGRAPVQHIKPEPRVVERIDPEEDFSDVIGDGMTRFRLENERSDRVYVWPEETPEDISRFQSGELGLTYTLETYEGDDVPEALRPAGMRGLLKKGDLIRVGSHVCASADRKQWEKRKRYEATQTFDSNRRAMRSRQGDVVAGEHGAGWQGLEGYR